MNDTFTLDHYDSNHSELRQIIDSLADAQGIGGDSRDFSVEDVLELIARSKMPFTMAERAVEALVFNRVIEDPLLASFRKAMREAVARANDE